MSLDSLGSASDGGASLVEDFGTAIEREIKECTICRDDVPLVAYVSTCSSETVLKDGRADSSLQPDDSTTKSCTHEINICGEFLRRHIEAEVNGKGETVGVKFVPPSLRSSPTNSLPPQVPRLPLQGASQLLRRPPPRRNGHL